MAITIHLSHHDLKVEFEDRDKFSRLFPTSMIASALRDSTVEVIDISERSITKEVLVYLKQIYDQGDIVQPPKELDLTPAYKYLGIEVFGILIKYPTFTLSNYNFRRRTEGKERKSKGHKRKTEDVNILTDVKDNYDSLMRHALELDSTIWKGNHLIRYLHAVTNPADHSDSDQKFLWSVKDPEVLKMFLKRHIDPTKRHGELLLRAICNGHVDHVRVLLKDGRIDPGLYDDLAVMYIVVPGASKVRIELIGLLLADPRIHPEARDNELLHALCGKVNEKEDVKQHILRLLQDRRVDPSSRGNCLILDDKYNLPLEVLEVFLKDDRVNPSARANTLFLMRCGRYSPTRKLNHEALQLISSNPRFDPNNFMIDNAVRLIPPECFKYLLDHPKLSEEFRDIIQEHLQKTSV